jgi:HSP20 family protein
MNRAAKGNNSVSVERRRPGRLLAWPEEVERYLDAQWRQWPFRFWRRPVTEEAWLPETDVFEKDGELVIRTDLPGMTAENIEVTLEGDILTIRGRREEEKEVKEEQYYCSERAVGEFLRTIRLPKGAVAEGIEAHYDNGVLEVILPKAAAAEAKAVKVQVK